MTSATRIIAGSLVCSLTACGGATRSGSTPAPPFAGDAAPAVCSTPPAPVDVSQPTTVVGDGTPQSCTAAALQQAASAGGVIVFDCGTAPVTIPVATQINFTKETVVDGGGLVTLQGNGARIFYLDSSYVQTGPRLTVQRLTFTDGDSPPGGNDTAVGGGAIYRNGGSLTVIDCTFTGNQAPSPGQDIAGGAIYGFGGGETVIAGSTFTGNHASDGGAVGSLNGDLIIVNSSFTQNAATGTGGNPGQGGCGGAVYMDGTHEKTVLCGVQLEGNQAGALGGGFFRVSNDHTGSFFMDRTQVDTNVVTPSDSGNAGGLYLEGLRLTITNSTISRNRAYYGGGLWITGGQAALTNVTIAENVAVGSNGGGLWLSTNPTGQLLNCTIAGNSSTGQNTVCGAIFGAGLSLKNTLISNNTAMWVPGCDKSHSDEGGNVQWPDGALCTTDIDVADPMLGALGDNGGPTETMLPSAASPAAGRGTGCPPTDQRGVARHEPCTAGAVELP